MKKKLILISGVSGAGKTTASNILEDMGYRCIDQFPVDLLADLIELIENDISGRYDHVALTIELSSLDKFLTYLNNIDSIDTSLILIDCSVDVAINRYKFTRRVHPLLINNAADTLLEAINIDKALIQKYAKTQNSYVIDTTNLSLKQHKEKLDQILNYDDFNNFSISFVSFGFKNGIPDDADLVFDVRILDNPFYHEELKRLTGNDKEVYDYVLSKQTTQDYLAKLLPLVDFTLKSYDKEEKRHLTICIGCTGGQHRSVSIANYLYEYYKDKYICYIVHRELKGK